MAILLLWVFVIVGFVMSIVDFVSPFNMDAYAKVAVIVILCVLAFCEAIILHGKPRKKVKR